MWVDILISFSRFSQGSIDKKTTYVCQFRYLAHGRQEQEFRERSCFGWFLAASRSWRDQYKHNFSVCAHARRVNDPTGTALSLVGGVLPRWVLWASPSHLKLEARLWVEPRFLVQCFLLSEGNVEQTNADNFADQENAVNPICFLQSTFQIQMHIFACSVHVLFAK